MRPPHGRRALVTVIALVAMTVSACGSGSSQSKSRFAGSVRTPPLQVASVSLPDVTTTDAGTPFPMRAPAGGYLLVYFGYTHCADECPVTLANLATATTRLSPDRRGRVVIAFTTVDPRRDTSSVLRSYVAHWQTPIHVLRTTDAMALMDAQHAFRSTSSPTHDMSGTIDHSASTAVVDDQGRVVLRVAVRPVDARDDGRPEPPVRRRDAEHVMSTTTDEHVRADGLRPITLIAQGAMALAVLVAIVVALLHHPTGGNGSSTGATSGHHVWEYSVPFGTGAALDAGRPVSFFPAQLHVRVGDQLLVHNEDNRSHQIGPYLVDRGETMEQTFTEPGVITGLCTIHPSGRVTIDVSK